MWKRFASSLASFCWRPLRSPAALTLLLALSGLALLCTGLWWIYPPLAPICAGLALLAEAERTYRKLTSIGGAVVQTASTAMKTGGR